MTTAWVFAPVASCGSSALNTQGRPSQADVERWADGSGRLTILRSKTDQEGKGAVVAVTPACLRALDAIRPENPGDGDRVFRLSIRQMANRIKDAVAAAGFDGQVRVLRRETPSDPQSELRQKTHA